MSLLIDTSQRAAPLNGADLRAWASQRTVFISSEMRALGPERRALAEALRATGLDVVLFEDLGGRDDDAEVAYLEGVSRSDLYVGLVGDRYGTMLASGRSPTHEEYREARRLGLRIAAWAAADGATRQGDARDFLAEVQMFHTTGSWTTSPGLVDSVLARVAEIGSEDASPWVKIGGVACRATSIEDDGRTLRVEAVTRDGDVAAALESLRPGPWSSGSKVPVTTADRSGDFVVTEVGSRTSGGQRRQLTITGDVAWSDGRRSGMAAGINGLPYEHLVELGLRAGLFGEALPERVGMLSGMVDTSDPLAPLDGRGLPHTTYRAVAALLVTERLVGQGVASRVEAFDVGPLHRGSRRIELTYREARAYSNVELASRGVAGTRSVSGA